MDINWSEKNTVELEKFFSTDINTGLDREQYLRSKAKYGENLIYSDALQKHNFYGLKKKKRNIKAMLSGSVGMIGVLYFFIMIILKLINPEIKIYIFLIFYIFLAVSAFTLSGNSEKKYEYLYKTSRPKALVIRENKRKKVFMENIVPGDVIILSAGDIVPADARIISDGYILCRHPDKNGDFVKFKKTSESPENIVYASDIIEYGSAFAIVIATGENTHTAINQNEPDMKDSAWQSSDECSFAQKRARKISKCFFLASVFLSMLIIVSGITQERDFIVLIMTCLAVSAACFPEQISIITDFAVLYGMHKLSKSGVLIKTPSAIDEINNIDTFIAKKTESFTQDKMRLDKIAGHDITFENLHSIGYILSCMAICANVTSTQRADKNKNIYSGSAVDTAVYEALDKCKLTYDGIIQAYKKIGRTIYDPQTGIKGAMIFKEGRVNFVCFGEASSILDRCILKQREQISENLDDLYREYDLVMAVASKDFNNNNLNNLNFLGFVCFSEPKTKAVFESIDYLKKGGVNPVMIADSDTVHMKRATVKFGLFKNIDSAHIFNDFKINAMDKEGTFYINSDKIRALTPISVNNKIKLLKALKFKRKHPALTVNDIEEINLTNESCTVFTSANTEAEILKNKAAVITNNLTVATVLKTIKNAVLIYRNTCKITHFSAMIFMSQYLFILFALLLNGAYILNPVQIIWSGIGAGYILAVSICFSDENKNWYVLRNKIKNYKKEKDFYTVILKYGFIYALLIFAFSVLSFFVCLMIKSPEILNITFKYYINSKISESDILSAQTAAFISYIISIILIAANHIRKSRRYNKIFITAFILNISGILLSVLVPFIRDFLDFGILDIKTSVISVLLGLCPVIITLFIKKRIFYEY